MGLPTSEASHEFQLPQNRARLEMRKYLFIAANEWPNWGGSELLWTQAAEKMARRGAKVFVSVPDFGKPLNQVERLRAAGCHVFARARPALPLRLATRIFRFPGIRDS